MQGPWLIAFFVQWMLVIILLVLVVGILRYLSSVKERWTLAVPAITRYELGEIVADFEAPDMRNSPIKIKELLSRFNRGIVILFVSAKCTACETSMQQVIELLSRQQEAFSKTLLIVALGRESSLELLLEKYPSIVDSRVFLLRDEKGAALSQFGITRSPTALVIGVKGDVIDQTFNPHVAGWMYKAFAVNPPLEALTRDAQTLVVPIGFKIPEQ